MKLFVKIVKNYLLIAELLFSQVTRYQPKKMSCNYHHNLLVPVALKVIAYSSFLKREKHYRENKIQLKKRKIR